MIWFLAGFVLGALVGIPAGLRLLGKAMGY